MFLSHVPCMDHSTQKIWFLGQWVCSVAHGLTNTHRQTDRHTDTHTHESEYRGQPSGFQEFFLQPISKDRSNICIIVKEKSPTCFVCICMCVYFMHMPMLTVLHVLNFQVQACQTEAERLNNLLSVGSPTLTSYLVLSPLLPAIVQHPSIPLPTTLGPQYSNSQDAGGASRATLPTSSHCWIVCVTMYFFLVIFQRSLNKL